MSSAPLSETAKKNIEAIAQVEHVMHDRRSRVERIGDWIARFFGSLWFIAAHVVLFTVWILLNVRILLSFAAFDPYPFPFLGLVVGIEFFFLTTFVLMNQNLQSKRQEHWGHLNLQICLLTEQEVTKNMQMLHVITRHLGLQKPATEKEVKEMAQTTPVSTLVEEIEKVLVVE
ncbi:MAG: hypothetical protein JWM11_773 [Planctomycetaceae bacterium]|nr:hypothetical protein [Planctomycetaceae bacterium]